jgi:UDP-glucose 4-epimerase
LKYVVTGGAGFIGSHIAESLSKKHEVIILDNLFTGKRENIESLLDEKTIECVEGSITDSSLLHDVFQNADGIFHQAAIPSVPRSIDNPAATNEANITGTLHVLIAAKDCGVKKVVYASSSSVYGDTPTLPKVESMTPNPKSPYAVSKLAGEYYCRVFSEVYGLDTVSLRYFNVFGPRQDPKSEYAAVIPKFITRILDGTPPIIYGDGEQTRDFTYVKNVVQANIRAMESDARGVFNIACGECISLNDLASIIMDIIGIHIDPIYDAPRPGDVRDSLADILKAQEQFNYYPEYDLKSGLMETIEWYRDR